MTKINKPMLIITAPSGGGKSTIIKRLLAEFDEIFAFQISVTTRPRKEGEVHGREYYYMSLEEFNTERTLGKMLECEEVYPGRWYGTQINEIHRIHDMGKIPILDLDVKGAQTLKELYGHNAIILFIAPPSMEILEERLRRRGRDTDNEIVARLERAPMELDFRGYDFKVINDDLDHAYEEIKRLITSDPLFANFL